MENQSTFTLSLRDAKGLSFKTRDEAVDIIIRLQEERDAFQSENEVLMNALWKACGDDEEAVNATIESQR